MGKKKDLDYYLNLPYTEVLRPDDDGDFVARIEELQGCIAHGETREKALESLGIMKELWIRDALENQDRIPEPEVEMALPSGKWVQRVPRSLHKKLVALAKREGTSLNQLVVSVLSAYVGASSASEKQKATFYEQTCYTTIGGYISRAFSLSSAVRHELLGRASSHSGWGAQTQRDEVIDVKQLPERKELFA